MEDLPDQLPPGKAAAVTGIDSNTAGRVASLHLHSILSGGPFQSVERFQVVANRGIEGNPRYFGKPTRRQVTLIERAQIAEHAATLGLEKIPPGVVRSNIETEGVDLIAWIGKRVAIGGAILEFYEARTPCHKMDAICPGLRDLMANKRQGVLATVIQSGIIRVGDTLQLDKGDLFGV